MVYFLYYSFKVTTDKAIKESDDRTMYIYGKKWDRVFTSTMN